MRLDEFHVGGEFILADKRYRVTDKGARVVNAIRVDSVEVGIRQNNGLVEKKSIDKLAATDMGYFRGPPYGVNEYAMDEDSQVSCLPVSTWMFFPEER